MTRTHIWILIIAWIGMVTAIGIGESTTSVECLAKTHDAFHQLGCPVFIGE